MVMVYEAATAAGDGSSGMELTEAGGSRGSATGTSDLTAATGRGWGCCWGRGGFGGERTGACAGGGDDEAMTPERAMSLLRPPIGAINSEQCPHN